MSTFNDLTEKPGDNRKTYIDTELDEHTSNDELWMWESMVMYHLKIDIDEIRSWTDEKFFGTVARLRWVIEQEQKQWKSGS